MTSDGMIKGEAVSTAVEMPSLVVDEKFIEELVSGAWFQGLQLTGTDPRH
ncbi:hypothetical protein ACMATS_38265 (plasmid) [Streptoverticillium reticulum]